MNENYPMGGTLTFTADDGVEVGLTSAPIAKAEALRVGLDFCGATDPERDALLADLGPVMIRRSLLVLGNVAARLGDSDAAAYAKNLRAEITTTKVRAS